LFGVIIIKTFTMLLT